MFKWLRGVWSCLTFQTSCKEHEVKVCHLPMDRGTAPADGLNLQWAYEMISRFKSEIVGTTCEYHNFLPIYRIMQHIQHGSKGTKFFVTEGRVRKHPSKRRPALATNSPITPLNTTHYRLMAVMGLFLTLDPWSREKKFSDRLVRERENSASQFSQSMILDSLGTDKERKSYTRMRCNRQVNMRTDFVVAVRLRIFITNVTARVVMSRVHVVEV